jgi:hypothetical protein
MSSIEELVLVCDKCVALGGSVWQFKMKMNPAESDVELMRDEAAKLGWHYYEHARYQDLCPPHARATEQR